MKLSSAFDTTLLLNGCTGKTNMVMDEVAAITNDKMSYLSKSNEMKTVENRQDMSNVEWSGVFSLSDKDGVNTIAYGSGGAIYGCYNYDNLNVASYSKSYAGNDIFASAYAVGEESKTDGSGSNPSAEGNSSNAFGIMIGATTDHLYIYNETTNADGGVSKTWSMAYFDAEGGSGINEATLEIWNIFSAGRMFFVATNQGLIAFSASSISMSSSKISSWEIISQFPSFDMLLLGSDTDEDAVAAAKTAILKGIQFIRKKEMTFSGHSDPVNIYIIGWSVNSLMSAAMMQQLDTGWNIVSLIKNEEGSLSDIFPLSEVSFPCDINSKAPSPYPAAPQNETIKWIDKNLVTVLSKNTVESNDIWNVKNFQNVGTPTTELKKKTPTGYLALARNAIKSGNASVDPEGKPNAYDDSTIPNLYAYNSNTRLWKYEEPWIVLEMNDPLPKYLEDQEIYWVAKYNEHGSIFSKWFESCNIFKKEGTGDPSEEIEIEKDETFELPENAIQLLNDEDSAVQLSFDISDLIADKILVQPIIGIQRTPAESAGRYTFQDLATQYYVTWESNSNAWSVTRSKPSGTTLLDGLFDFSSGSGYGTPYVKESYSTLAYPDSANDSSKICYFGDDMNLNGHATYDSAEATVKLDIHLNNYSTPFFDKNVKFKVALEVYDRPTIDFSEAPLLTPTSTSYYSYPIKIIKIKLADPNENEAYLILQYSSFSGMSIRLRDSLTLSGGTNLEENYNYPVIPEIEVESLPGDMYDLDGSLVYTEDGIYTIDAARTQIGRLKDAESYVYFDEFEYVLTSSTTSRYNYKLSLPETNPIDTDVLPYAQHRFIYSYTGILSYDSISGNLQGNSISCSLQFANGHDLYDFSTSALDVNWIKRLVPSGGYAGHSLCCSHDFYDASGHFITTRTYPVGTVKLERTGSLSSLAFKKSSVEGEEILSVPQDELSPQSIAFVPKIQIDSTTTSNFNVTIPCTKTIAVYNEITQQTSTETLSVELNLSIPLAYVIDKNDWTGQYLEDFQDCIILSNDEWHYLSTSRRKGIFFSRNDALDGSLITECQPISINSNGSFECTVAFATSSGNACRVAVIPADNSFSWNQTSYRIPKSILSNGHQTSYLLGNTIVCGTKSINGSIGTDFNLSCLNFNLEEGNVFHQHVILEDESSLWRTISVIQEEDRFVLNINTETGHELLDEEKNSSLINFAINENTPIFIENIDGSLEVYCRSAVALDSSTEENQQFLLVSAANESFAHASELIANVNSILLLKKPWQYAQVPDVNSLCNIEYNVQAGNEQLKESAKEIRSIPKISVSKEEDAVAYEWTGAVSEGNAIRIMSVVLTDGSTGLQLINGSYPSASNDGSMVNALERGLIASDTPDEITSWIKLKQESATTYKFGSMVWKDEIPYVQYSVLKQVQWIESSPKKIVQWNTSFPLESFTLYIQNPKNAASSWKEAQKNSYDSTKTHFITEAGGWPEFWPVPGNIYNVTESHLTDSDSSRYSAGQYIYLGDADLLDDCYARLPYLDNGIHDSGLTWQMWIDKQKDTYLMAVGSNTGESFAKVAKALLSDTNVVYFQETPPFSRSAGVFRMNGIPVLPYHKCDFSAIIDSGSARQPVYVGINVGNVYLAVEETESFFIPKFAGLFINGQNLTFGVSSAVVDIDSDIASLEPVEIASAQDALGLYENTAILEMTTRQDPSKKNWTSPVWMWEASLVPYQVNTDAYGTVYVVGMAGIMNVFQNGNTNEITLDKKYVYAKSLSKGSLTATATAGSAEIALPKVYPPYNVESSNPEDREYVFYDEYGFHVKSNGNTSISDDATPKSLSGTDSMSSISTIKTMTTFKAYNAPIVVGLYEKGGLILYYGTKCFDRSILALNRFVYANDSEDGNEIATNDSFDSYVEQQAIDIFEMGGRNLGIILSGYLKNEELIDSAISLYASTTVDASELSSALNQKIRYLLNDDVPEPHFSDELEEEIQKIEIGILRQEARCQAEKDADTKFIKSYEYSVNNSTESQWINIPIYVKNTKNPDEVNYDEVDEELSTLTSSVVNGRIRLTVGSCKGNIYWRDLNPLHADKYISFIPTGMLTQKDQTEISEIVIPERNENLRKFLDGYAIQDAGERQTTRVGWKDCKWTYTGSSPVAGQTEYTACQNSKCISSNGSQRWLLVNGEDKNIEISAAEAAMVENDSQYAPYVLKHSTRWVLGGKITSFSEYANEPEVKIVNNVPKWHVDNQNTNVTAVAGEYPQFVIYNGNPSWKIGNGFYLAHKNGQPYIQDRTWLIDEYGKTSPTTIFTLDENAIIVQTMEKKVVDVWGINDRSINYTSLEDETPLIKFKVGYRPCWNLLNVLDNDVSSTVVTPYSSKKGQCPFVLEPDALGIIDTHEEEPVWKSTSKTSFNEACVEADMFHIEYSEESQTYKLCTVENSALMTFNAPEASTAEQSNENYIPYYIGKSGREWWMLPRHASYPSRIGPYTTQAEPSSKIGTRWTFQKITTDGSVQTVEWDTFDAPQGSKITQNESSTWLIGDIDTGYSSSSWYKPKFKCTIWKWSISAQYPSIVLESGECPYIKRPEYCMWANGFNAGNCSNINDLHLFIAKSSDRKHWFVDGADTGIQCDDESQYVVEIIPGTTASSKWRFNWKVQNKGVSQTIAETNSCVCPLTKESAFSWWMTDKYGNEIDTKIDANDPLSAKGLETDGIASRLTTYSEWNEKTKAYETTEPQWTSWTPLASLFVDAYRETSYGVLESINDPWSVQNPKTMKEGMVWEMMSSMELFGEENVYIADSKTTAWEAYQESEKGNTTSPAFTVYIGWKQNEAHPELFDSYCTIVSLSTDSMVKWKVSAKEWKFQHLELVTKRNGELNNIVILSTRGWIASTGHLSFTNDKREIKTVEWNTPVNPVAEVLKELEKLIAYKWNSWDSNSDSEFAAVGSYGVYVYSEDCQTFKASIPYGEDAELFEVVWDGDKNEFKIWGRDVVSTDDDQNETTTVEKSEDDSETSSSSSDFESAYESSATNKNQPQSISISSLSETTLYRHNHKTMDGTKETLWYIFSSATTTFEELKENTLSDTQKTSAIDIVPDLEYRFSSNNRIWKFIYSKCRTSNGQILGSGFTSTSVSWRWMWNRSEIEKEAQKMSYITVSENTKAVAYGFPDLKRFIKSYKNLYTDSMEFVGSVCQFATSEKDSSNADGKSLKESYEELANMDGLKIYSNKLAVAWDIYKKAKRLRDNSHYAENDCYNTYLQKIGQSLALEYKDYFNRAKRAMWTAQAFKNYYEMLSKKGAEK